MSMIDSPRQVGENLRSIRTNDATHLLACRAAGKGVCARRRIRSGERSLLPIGLEGWT